MKTIKNIFKSKITYAVLACLLLVGIFAGISTIAGKAEPTLTITGKNINHSENASVVYEVKIDNVSADFQLTANMTMKFWMDPPKSAADPAGYVDDEPLFTRYENGAQYATFESLGFAPKDMTKAIYAAACYTDAEGNETYSEIVRYSVYEYIIEAGNNENKTAEQANLYAAMKDYITYAQKYLGYTAGLTPSDIGYITIEYGYLIIRDDPTQEHHTTAAIPVGVYYDVYYDFAGLPYRADTGYTYTSIDKPINTIVNGVTAGDLARTFTISKIVSVNVPAIENTQIVSYKPVTNSAAGAYIDGKLALLATNAKANTEAGTYVVTERYVSFKASAANGGEYHNWGIAANPYNEKGLPFSHWAYPDGTVYSYETAIVFNELDLVKSKNPEDPTTYDFTAVPVYDEANQTLDSFTTTYSAEENGNVFTTLENGFNFNATGKTNTSSGNTAQSTAARTNLDGSYKMMLSFNLSIAKHELHDATAAGDARKALYGATTHELYFNIGGQTLFRMRHNMTNACDVSQVNINRTTTGSAANITFNGNMTQSGIKTGEDNRIDFIVEYSPLGNGTYTVERISVYVNGIYCGFCGINYRDTRAFALSGNFDFRFYGLYGNKSNATVTNIKFYEFAK